MTRLTLTKRLKEAEVKIRKTAPARAEAQARAVTPERWEAINRALDAERRKGLDTSDDYYNTLSDGERLRLQRDRAEWVRKQAEQITPEHILKLEADGIEIDRWTDAELRAVIGEEDDGLDWDSIPGDILDQIIADPKSVDFGSLKKLYPTHQQEQKRQG